tara:strand:- start:426 stop:590 length:165 start_codon:yes stop_codon:yes gene_type:complete
MNQAETDYQELKDYEGPILLGDPYLRVITEEPDPEDVIKMPSRLEILMHSLFKR